MTVEELKKFDAGSWKGEAFKGEPIPTFREVLEIVKGRTRLFVEMKVPELKRCSCRIYGTSTCWMMW